MRDRKNAQTRDALITAGRLGVAVDEDVRPRWWAGVAFATFNAGYHTWLAHNGELSAHLASAIRLLEPNPHQARPSQEKETDHAARTTANANCRFDPSYADNARLTPDVAR